MDKACLNCGSPRIEQYCPTCGQKDIEPGVRLTDVVGDFLSYNFSIEGPIWKTLNLLVRDPGRLFREFVQGRRKDFYKPIQFFIITSLLYFGFAELINYDPLHGQFQREQAPQVESVMPTIKMVTQFMVRHINNFLFLLIFVTAAWLKVFRWKAFSYAEYLVVGFYLVGVYIIIGMSDLVLDLFDYRAGFVKVYSFFLYVGYAFASLFAPLKVGRFLIGLLIGIISFVTYFLSAFGLSFLWLMIGR